MFSSRGTVRYVRARSRVPRRRKGWETLVQTVSEAHPDLSSVVTGDLSSGGRRRGREAVIHLHMYCRGYEWFYPHSLAYLHVHRDYFMGLGVPVSRTRLLQFSLKLYTQKRAYWSCLIFLYNSVSQTVVRGPQAVLGFCPCGPFRLNISPKKTEKIKLTWIAYHTL